MAGTSGQESLTQSPVNISTNDTPTQLLNEVLVDNYQSAPITIFNNGNGIDAEFETQQNFVTYKGEQYFLDGFHLHTDSENTFNGQTTDSEIHLVHISNAGNILVVGRLLEGVDPNGPDANLIDPQLSSFFGNLDSSLADTSVEIDGGNFDPSQLISNNSQIYNFGGSLTTPPFSDATWVVAADTLKVSQNDVQNFSDLQENLYGFPDGLNNRPVQNELFLGTSSGNLIQGDRNGISGFSDDLIYARSGNDTVKGGQGDDKIFGQEGVDILIGGQGDDIIVGDSDLAGVNLDPSSKDYLIGSGGKDTLYLSGNDIALGGGPLSLVNNLISFLDNPLLNLLPLQLSPLNLSDGEQDTFVFENDGFDYNPKIVEFEAGIDSIDLREYNVGTGLSGTLQSERQGLLSDWWEYTTPNVNGSEVVFQIDANPTEVNAALI